MAFPTVSAGDSQSGIQTSNSTSWTGTYPTNIVAGDLIMLFVSADGGGVASATGFTQIQTRGSTGPANTISALALEAAGTESGSFTITISASEQGCWRTIRIPASQWFSGSIGSDTDSFRSQGANGGTSTNPDPPANNPTNWDVEDTLWIVFAGSDHGNTTYTGFPTNYTQEDHSTAGGHAAESGGAGGAGMGVAYRQLAAASEDPGTFTTDATEDWGALTIAVRPAAAAGPKSFPAARAYRYHLIRR